MHTLLYTILNLTFFSASKANENPTLFVLPIGDKTTRKENMEFLLQFLEAEEVCKVCYNTQDSLKVVMEEFPTSLFFIYYIIIN